jgi:hypothetical protein
MALNREAFLSGNIKPDLIPVSVPEISNNGECHVMVKAVSQAEFEAWREQIQDRNKTLNETGFIARLIILCVCDEAGEPLFNQDDFEAIGKLPAKVLMRIQRICQDQLGIGDEDADELVGKSKTTTS